MNHDLLVKKSHAYGIRGTSLKFSKTYEQQILENEARG